MIQSKANLLLKKYFYKFMILRTLKTFIQPKVPLLDESTFDKELWATMRPSRGRPPALAAGEPQVTQMAHQRSRQEIFERWSRASHFGGNYKKWMK